MLDITVCIMSYNRLVFLREAIASVLAQSRQPRHIIVYDNGSDDTVRSGVQDYSERGIQWRGAEANQPFIWNFQRALSNCTSKYILMLHDDDRLCTDFLYLQTQLLDAHDDIAAVSCNGYFIDGSGTRTGNMLSQAVDGKPVHFFNYSGQIALRYAEGSCIPFSPTIYRTDMAMRVKPRSDLGKVFDAAYFCDLLQFGRPRSRRDQPAAGRSP